MKFGFIATSGSAHQIINVAREVEASGWDGFFTFDGGGFDPWSLLAGAAMVTSRITLGAMVFVPSRRRPWNVVNQALTVDHLANGRLVLPVGLGATDTDLFAKVQPEVTDRRERAERLDETLEIMSKAWTGQPFSHYGKHYRIEGLSVPQPVQQPRIPIWVVGSWPRPKSMARAATWDGVIPSISAAPFDQPTPEQVADVCAWMREHRPSGSLFDVVIEGVSPPNDPTWVEGTLRPLADAGATWWIESRWEAPNDPETLLKRIRQGPPRLE